MQDPLSGTKATADFVTELMTAREQESAEVEKAGAAPSIESLSPDAQDVYRRCMDGFSEANTHGENAEKVCSLYARDFDQRHPNGLSAGEAEGSEEEPAEVEKTVSAAGMAADLGSPSADVALTDVAQRKRRLGQTA